MAYRTVHSGPASASIGKQMSELCQKGCYSLKQKGGDLSRNNDIDHKNYVFSPGPLIVFLYEFSDFECIYCGKTYAM